MLKKRWKNLRDGFTKCCKKVKDHQRSGAANTSPPSCKYFKQLEFLRDQVQNNSTCSNVNLPDGQNSGVDQIISPPPTPTSPSLSLQETVTPSLKRKLVSPDSIASNSRRARKQDTHDQIDLLLVNALSKENEPPKNETRKSSNELFCASLVEIMDRLSNKHNQMARIGIMQILLKHEFAED